MNSRTENATVMVVDDAPINLELLEEMLHGHGLRVVTFHSGAMALRAAAKSPPDLILLDVMMPEMDGFEMCRRWKEDETLCDIPVIFISVLDDLDSKVRGFFEGGVDYVGKPFHEEEVLARVNTHLEIASLQRRLRAQNENLEQIVAKRTEDLMQAHERLVEVDRLKDDFLHMITHEIRTPVSGVLGVGELILGLCPLSEEGELYKELFRRGCRRLNNLVDDAAMISEMEHLTDGSDKDMSLSALLGEVKRKFPNLRIAVDRQVAPESLVFRASPTLLKKALETMLDLASCFSQDATSLRLAATEEGACLNLRIDLDNLPLTQEVAEKFFDLESTVRSSSRAEALGLAPVVAHNILSDFGGSLRLVKEEGETGYLEAIMLTNSLPVSKGS